MRLGLARQSNVSLPAQISVVGCLGDRDAAFAAAIAPQVRKNAWKNAVLRDAA